MATPENNRTNACAFIALAICNWFLGTETKVDWLEIKLVSENLITSMPFLVNDSRDVHKAYEPLSAYEVLRKKSMVSELQLSEEFINNFTVFTEAGKDALTNALVSKAHETEKAIAMYMCAPYTFVIGIYQEKLFLSDSHPINEVLGSDGNGILLVSKNLSVKSCKTVGTVDTKETTTQWNSGWTSKPCMGN